ncbi:radical SAM protein [Candidatus Kuenenia stuttgartiensis]|uniref:radical SAM protein n=1 Tax=Kuenenia stuttgartiensis TaxID=174633 RepID=UPI00146D9CF3|nr:radical SAM protein [Candidatus Kuenenia stuttgartiensis]
MPSEWAFVSVDMEIANICRAECLLCPRDSITRQTGIMSEETFKAISEKLVREGSLITFSGMGDPLSHPMVFEWIRELRGSGGDVGIVVNPASLGDTISPALVQARPNVITLSFPQLEKRCFWNIVPGTPYDQAIARAMELINLSAGNVGLRITGIRTEMNQDEHEAYERFWRGVGIPSSMVACHGRGGNVRAPGVYERRDYGTKTGNCGLFRYHTFITWEGNVLACCHDLTGAALLGISLTAKYAKSLPQKKNVEQWNILYCVYAVR